MSYRLRLFAPLAIAASLTACARTNMKPTPSVAPQAKDVVDANSILNNKALSNELKAEALAEGAEKLFFAQGFEQADTVADQALKLDQTNAKALFLSATLAPILAQKGIVARLEPLAAVSPRTHASYAQLRARVESMPNSALKAFVLNGRGDITNEVDLQKQIDEIGKAFSKMRMFAKKNKDAKFDLHLSSSLLAGISGSANVPACEVRELGSLNYDIKCAEGVETRTVRVARAELELVQQAGAAGEIAATLGNIYSLDGALKVALDHKLDEAKETPSLSTLMNELFASAGFGKLRNAVAMKRIKLMGADAVTGSQLLLPTDFSENKNFNVTTQLRSRVNAETKLVQDILAGKEIDVTAKTRVGRIQAKIDANQALEATPKDLRDLKPTVSSCNTITAVADPTLGGIVKTTSPIADKIANLGACR